MEQEQEGSNKVNYGEELLILLSSELTKEFGKGYSLTNLKLIRKFYLVYSSQKSQTVFDQSKIVYNFKTKTLSYNDSKKQIEQTVFAESKININFNNYSITNDGH